MPKAWKSSNPVVRSTRKRSAPESGVVVPARKKAKRSRWKKKKESKEEKNDQSKKNNSQSSCRIPLDSNMIEIANKNKWDIPKKKTALLVGYCGLNYQGLQLNPNANTIELKIIQALFMAGAISENDLQSLQSVRWMRCARTDKGVHAIGQVLSCWLMMNSTILQATNQHLPDDIRIFDYTTVSKGFHSQKNCDGRTYEYILRTDLLRPSSRHPDFAKASEWKLTDKKRVKFESMLKKYEGTRKYHNFTKRGDPTKENVKRFITSMSVSEIYNVDDMEFIRVTLKGQSFVLHQIRKMIAATAIIFRDGAPMSAIDKLLSDSKFDIPMAPGLGLILRKCHFDHYEEGEGKNCSVDFDCTQLQEKFLSSCIEQEIYNHEKVDNVTMKWIAEFERGGYLFNPLDLTVKA